MSILGPNPFRPKTAAELFAPLSSRLGLTTLEFHASPLWASTQPDHRALLHAALTTRVTELGAPLIPNSLYPLSDSISISISHAKTVGGFALLATREGCIGFDIEEVTRVSAPIADRIRATQPHPETRPSQLVPALYWSAKEAAFKAIRGPHQPAVLSDLGLGSWQSEGAAAFFEIKFPESIQGLGYTLTEKEHALAVFVVNP